VREECEYLSRVRPAENNNEPLYLYFKGAGKLDPVSLAVLESLLQFRRSVARKKDRPLFKIFSNRCMLKLALAKPNQLKILEQTKCLSPKQLNMYAQELLEAIRRGLALPPDELPVYPRHRAPIIHPAVPGRIRALKDWRSRKAKDLEIEPGLLLNKTALTALALSLPRDLKSLGGIEDLKAWQIKTFGPDIIRVLKKKR
jgi:ribonuclease D